MQFSLRFSICVMAAAFCALLGAQTAPAPETPAVHATKGIPARGSAAEYMGHGKVGALSIGADFDGHDIPTLESTLTTEDFVAVEVGVFGAPGAHAIISAGDFSLRINGKKSTIPTEGFSALTRNLRDPSWTPPDQKEKEKSRGGLNTGGQQDDLGATPAPVHIPPEMERAMRIQVQEATLPEGDRALPVAGLIFFKYSGQQKGIHQVELVYEGPAGKGSVRLQ
ncbi:MAG TPA: hypothetical protein VHC90_20405 [Bryobacteraceae bacterium]|nr:hypothetical protein [Bryobacteraceae bacterium]